MKKFYEAPVVEFAGFDTEDVITTSSVDTTNMVDAGTIANFKAGVDAYAGEGAVADTYKYSSYEW